MKICIGNDHHGVKLKKQIINHLNLQNIECLDCGSQESENIDYIDSALKVCQQVKNGNCDLGVLICGTGIGMSIAANKVKGIYCAKVSNEKEAKLSREHNNANVIAVSEEIENIEQVIESFIKTTPSLEERHIRRLKQVEEVEKRR